MPDGRRMHYYEWPATPPDRPPPDFEHPSAPPAPDADEQQPDGV